MIFYQINPQYFLEIAISKFHIDKEYNKSFYNLVSECLDQIKETGFDSIWIMPLYERGYPDAVGGGSPYAVKNYSLSARWGTEEELINLIKVAHDKGFKIITEFIPNHMAQSADFISNYPDLVYRDSKGNILFDDGWGDTAKLKHTEPRVQEFIAQNIEHILNYGFDGLRLDMSHYPFYSLNEKNEVLRLNEEFWDKVKAYITIDLSDKYFVGEAYDDRNKNAYGYGDQIQLFKSNIGAYEKKYFDIIQRELKNHTEYSIQNDFYNEYEYQKEASSFYTHSKYSPFLRFTSNHDDAPAIQNFTGTKAYIAALSSLLSIKGEFMMYAGDEYGLAVKPSVTGQTKYDQSGHLSELDGIQFIDQNDQDYIYQNVKKLLSISPKFRNMNMIIPEYLENQGNILVVINYSLDSKEIIITCTNFSQSIDKQWAILNYLYTDATNLRILLKDLILKVIPNSLENGYNLKDLMNDKQLDHRDLNDNFVIALDPLEVQILNIY